MKTKHSLSLFILALGVAFVTLTMMLSRVALAQNAPDSAPNWSTEVRISDQTHKTKIPALAVSANGQKVVVAYQKEEADLFDNDVYYSVSTDGGVTWPNANKGLPLHVSPGVDSGQIDLTIAVGGTAHAVWTEDASLAYADESDWATNSVTLLSQPALVPGATNPVIVASGSNILDIVWSELPTAVIYHTRSTNGGSSWSTPTAVSENGNRTRLPALAVDPDNVNQLYTVWDDSPVTPFTRTVYFAAGTADPGTGNVTWSTPIPISADGASDNDVQPKIIVAGNELQVVYDHIEDVQGEVKHTVYFTKCSNNCTQPDSWTAPINISGPYSTVSDNTPLDIIPAVTHYRGCTFVYFHGGLTATIEYIWGINSCDNWNGGGYEQLTSGLNRTIYPAVVTGGDGRIYIAYDKVIPTEKREIYFQRGVHTVSYKLYHPIIPRN